MLGFRKMKGMVGPEMLVELLAGLGMQIGHRELEPGQYPLAFQIAAKSSMAPGAKVLELHGQDREGMKIHALIVIAPGTVLPAEVKQPLALQPVLAAGTKGI